MADPISLTISGASLAVSVGTFAWLHRRVDSVLCTLLDCTASDLVSAPDYNGPMSLICRLSFANLGTRAVLLHDAHVTGYAMPSLEGAATTGTTLTDGQLPQLIKAGEMYTVSIRVKWNNTFLWSIKQEAKSRGEQYTSIFFEAQAVLWNPKGRRMVAHKEIARFREKEQGWTLEVLDERSFPAVKANVFASRQEYEEPFYVRGSKDGAALVDTTSAARGEEPELRKQPTTNLAQKSY